MAKGVSSFRYRLVITDGDNSGHAFVEIVDVDDSKVLLGEIYIEIENAEMHARKIVSALNGKSD